MLDKCLQIVYSNPQAVYCPGRNVEGVVHLDLKESLKARSLKVAIHGQAYTHWNVRHSRAVRRSDGTYRTEYYTVPYSAKVIYVDCESVAWTSAAGAKQVLQAGVYKFPFIFALPLNCAPSFEGLHGYIRYMIKVELDRPWRFNKTGKRPFTVVPIFDLNVIPEIAMPVRELTVKNLGVLLFRHGKVTIQCELSKRGFVPGEAIVINALINNDSSKNLVKASMKLLEISKYVAHQNGSTYCEEAFRLHECGNNLREQRRKLATGEQDICVEKKSKGTVQLYLQVPPTVPSFNCCPIISVEHIVEIKFRSLASFRGDIESCFPVIVGTIPVHDRNIFTQPTPPVQNMPSTSSVGPSAPPLETAPLYPTWGETNGHLPPPPSYEESVNGVDGTTMDSDNIEPFVPRYPFYPKMAPPEKSGDSLKT